MILKQFLPMFIWVFIIITDVYGVETKNSHDIVSQITRKEGLVKFDQYVKDFGEVHRGQALTHRFIFENIGKGDLIIQAVHTPCGCTVVKLDKGKVYRPREQGYIDVYFDTTDFSGRVSKSFTILTNERRKKVKTLVLKAKVKPTIDVNPPLVDFGNIRAGEKSVRRVQLKSADGKPFQIVRVEENPNFNVQVRKESEHWLVDIRMENSKPGILRDMIAIDTDHATLKTIPVPVVAKVRGNVSFQPDYLDFGSVGKKQVSHKTIRLSSDRQYSITSFDINMYINGLKVEVPKYIKFNPPQEPQMDRMIDIGITNPEGLSGSVAGDIKLKTDFPNGEDIRIEFYAFFQE